MVSVHIPRRAPLLCRAIRSSSGAILLLLALAGGASARSASEPSELLRQLGDPSPAVRARAAATLGRQRTGSAGPQLERALRDDDASVRVEALRALGLLGLSRSRAAIVPLLADRVELVSAAAEQALGALDRAGGARPRVFLVIEPPEAGSPGAAQAPHLIRSLAEGLGKGAVVADAGESKLLGPARLAKHLARRKLSAFRVRPTVELQVTAGVHSSTVVSKITIVCAQLSSHAVEFVTSAEAEAQAATPRLPEARRARMERLVLQASAKRIGELVEEHFKGNTGKKRRRRRRARRKR